MFVREIRLLMFAKWVTPWNRFVIYGKLVLTLFEILVSILLFDNFSKCNFLKNTTRQKLEDVRSIDVFKC